MNTHQLEKECLLEGGIRLEILRSGHAPLLLELVNHNRPLLRQWLPWVDYMQTVENFTEYIGRCNGQLQQGTDVSYLITVNEQAAGRIGLHHIDHQNKSCAVGYWIAEAFSGKGIVTKACRGLITIAFETLGLNRIEIKCATGNQKSAAVAERLGFKKEGVLRQAEWVNDQPLGLNVYSLLRHEWKKPS